MNLNLVGCLIETLKRKGIVFCHWKSNFYLTEALANDQELDLLVARQDSQAFESVLVSLDFRQAIDPLQARLPAVLHFYGLDRMTATWVHLHVYYRIITGESLIKNYCFPLEDLMLQNPRFLNGMPIPQAPAELMLLVIRIMLKHATPIEYLLLRRLDRSGYEAMREELEALLADDAAAHCSDLLARWLPSVDRALFYECIEALRRDAFIVRRYGLGRQLSRQLKIYRRFSPIQAMFLRTTLLLKLVFRRFSGAGKSKQLVSGGRLIAFVGPEATGKSTLVWETKRWLGQAFDVSSAHLGKPPSTWLTLLPNLTLRMSRKVIPEHKVSQMKNDAGSGDPQSVSLIYALRAVLLAWDRRVLAAKLQRKVANGSIVICDRYPSGMVGAMDSARLNVPANGVDTRSRLLGYLTALERRIYQQIPSPDVVIRLTVPVEVAMARNQVRRKREGDDYVRRRYASGVVPEFPMAQTIELDSNQSESQTIRSARQIVWDAL